MGRETEGDHVQDESLRGDLLGAARGEHERAQAGGLAGGGDSAGGSGGAQDRDALRRRRLRRGRAALEADDPGSPTGGTGRGRARGRKVGTLFVVGGSGEVVRRSKPMILDPLQGHPDEDKYVDDPNMRETIKELAQLDGAFVVSNVGGVLSAARYIDAASSDSLKLPLGLGSRHMARASTSPPTDAAA